MADNYNLSEALIYNMSPEMVESEKLRDIIIGHVIAMDGENDYGPEVVGALLSAYNHAVCDEAANNEEEPEVFVGHKEAEQIFLKAFVAGIKHVLKCNDDYAHESCWFPECIPYKEHISYSKAMMKDIGFCLGYRSGHHTIAMRAHFENG